MAATKLTVECCVCGKTKTNRGWKKIDMVNETPRSHGYCPHCFKTVMTEIVNMQAMEKASHL
mgnify:CR=1 FL=1